MTHDYGFVLGLCLFIFFAKSVLRQDRVTLAAVFEPVCSLKILAGIECRPGIHLLTISDTFGFWDAQVLDATSRKTLELF